MPHSVKKISEIGQSGLSKRKKSFQISELSTILSEKNVTTKMFGQATFLKENKRFVEKMEKN